MREAFAHEATVTMDAGSDVNALGAAVTTALCGHWQHEPPCPLSPHHSQARRLAGDSVYLRVLFATEPDMEGAVRGRIESALRNGELPVPEHSTTRWQLQSINGSPLTPDETAHAQRLMQS